MYNVHKYNEEVRMQQENRERQERYAKFLLKHEDFKEKAAEKQKEKLETFLAQQMEADKTFVFQDDHYKHWRKIRQFRDVEDKTKFLSFKSFRHKPNKQMGRIFNERQRKQITYLSNRKEKLVKDGIIPNQQRSRSLRCQGPLNPKITFRQRRPDQEYLQPRLRFQNITDRERINESHLSFDDKFHSLYKSFEMTKSKIGRATVSKIRYDKKKGLDQVDQTHSQIDGSNTFYFSKEQAMNEEDRMQSPTISKMLNSDSPTKSSNDSKGKLYFKLAKTMHLLKAIPEQQKIKIEKLMRESQYERKKDLTNIKHNINNENYIKSPIL